MWHACVAFVKSCAVGLGSCCPPGVVAGGPPCEAGAPPSLCSLRGVGRAGSAGRRGGRAPRVLPEAFAEQGRPFDFPAGEEAPSVFPEAFAEQGRPFHAHGFPRSRGG